MICCFALNLRFHNCFALLTVIISMFCKMKIKRFDFVGSVCTVQHTQGAEGRIHIRIAKSADFSKRNKETIFVH